MPRQHFEDIAMLLTEHELELRETFLRREMTEVFVLMLDDTLFDCCGGACEDRWFYRHEIRQLRRELDRVQRLTGTAMVLDSRTFDMEACDEVAELIQWDVDRLAWVHGITFPMSAINL